MRGGNIETMVAGTIKVVQILPDLNEGGVEKGTLELGAFLTESGHQSIVISGGGRMVSQLESEGSRHLTWPHIGEKSPRCLKYFFPLRRFLLKEGVDIVHLRSRLPAWVAFLAWKSLPVKRRPVLITTFHGFYSVNFYSAIMTRGERIVAVSRTIADHIREAYDVAAERIVLIPRGVDEKLFNPENVTVERIRNLKERWGLNGNTDPVVMLPGRVTRLKGQDVFLQSLAGIKELPWKAIMVGESDATSEYTRILEKMVGDPDLRERVKFVGHCSDMPAAMTLADIVVSTSTKPESFGRTSVEAQAMRKPVIVSAHGGSLETVLDGKTGWHVKPGDSEALSACLRIALSDESVRKKMGVEGRKWVVSQFTVTKMCEKTVALYQELLLRKSSWSQI